jgi:peroxiredoxin
VGPVRAPESIAGDDEPAADQPQVSGFESLAIDGREIRVAAGAEARWTVVCFVGNDCPLVKLYAHKLNRLQAEFADRGVQWVAINSNRQDSVEQMQAFAREHELTVPLVADPFHRLADLFSAQRTPEVFVLDRELKVRYRGRIDDQYQPGVIRPAAQREDLKIALDELLAGQGVAVPRTTAVGCLIGRVRDAVAEAEVAGQTETRVPTFAEHVAPVVYRHCAECHRPNEIGPFALVEYEDVRGWGEMMVEVIDQGLMPPWHASPASEKFKNHREMPESDKQLIRDWVAAGAPLGDPERLPPQPEPAGEWLLPREPDLVLAMGSVPFQVPSQGVVEYKHFVVDPGLKEDVWIQAAQILPGNRSVVHHTIVFVKPPNEQDEVGRGWLAAYVPGQRPLPYPPGYARKIPAGSSFIFQMHYTPNGTPQEDLTRLGLFFVDPQTVTHQVDTLIALEQNFEIPPHDPHFSVSGSLDPVPQQGELLGLSPHMHYRGKSVQLTAVTSNPDQPPRVILDVPRYDFNWQHVYAFAQPLPLAGIKQINFVTAFDNSAANPANPNPNASVTWGDQSWEEMAIVYFDVAWQISPIDPTPVDTESPDGATTAPHGGEAPATAIQPPLPTRNGESTPETLTAPELSVVEQEVERFLAQFAAPGQTSIPRAALPEAIRRFANLDQDDDGQISRAELLAAFTARQLRLRRASKR